MGIDPGRWLCALMQPRSSDEGENGRKEVLEIEEERRNQVVWKSE